MSRRPAWTRAAWSDDLDWQRRDRKALERISTLVDDALREPLGGIGKPERLLESLVRLRSRRIDDGNRLVYTADDDHRTVIACRYHY